jgi:hypothetical protein
MSIMGTNDGTAFATRMVASRRKPVPLRCTERDAAVVAWIYDVGLATREQIQALFFGPRNLSRCKNRLTLLYRGKYIDRLPRRAVSSPDIYYVSRHCTNGLRLLRAGRPEAAITPLRWNPHTVAHTLAIASARIAVVQACRAAGYQLLDWQSEAQLTAQMTAEHLFPDGWFQIERATPAGPKRASFFLEVERSGKSIADLEAKFRRYADFYYSGRFASAFGTRALRILFLVGASYGIRPERQIAKLAAICARVQLTIVRLAALDDFLAQDPNQLWFAPFWQRPGSEEVHALFEEAAGPAAAGQSPGRSQSEPVRGNR